MKNSIHFSNICGVGPDVHIYLPEFEQQIKKIHIFADQVRVDYFSLLHCS